MVNMNRLNKKLLRDIRLNKMQFFNIFMMVFLGVFVFAGVHAYMDGMKISGEKYYEANNLQDIWVAGENFKKDDLESIKKIDNVKNAERVLTLNTDLDGYKDVTLEANFIESNDISKMYIVDGEEFSKDKKGLWLDSYLAKNLGIKVGDKIAFLYQGYKVEEEVLGLVNTPDHVYFVKDETAIFPTHKDFGYCYLSINEFPEEYIYDNIKENIISSNPLFSSLKKEDIKTEDVIKFIPDFNLEDYYVFNKVIVDVSDTEKLNDTKIDIENKISSAIAVTDREASSSCEVYNSEIEEGQTYSQVFTFLFLFIAMLSVVTTMSRFVKKQRTQIGTLKALGFKNGKITKHYVSYGFYISLVAAIAGILVGKLLLGSFFLNMEMSYFEVPVYNTVLIPLVYILALATVILITLVTYLSCRKILKEPAVEALRVEIPKVKNTKFDFTTKGIFKKSSISTRWNLRDIGRNKSRSMMAVVGIIGCTMLLVCAFGMLDTMNSYLTWEFDKISNFEYKLSLTNDYTENEFNDIINTYGNSTSKTVGIELKINDKKETNTLVVNDAKDCLKYTDHNKEYIDLKDDGVYVTEKLADKYNLKVGDEISYHAFGDDKWYVSKIVGLNRDPQNQNINMTRNYYESLGLTYKADTVYTNVDLSNTKEIKGVDTIQSISSLKNGMQSMLETVKTMIVILILVSSILGFVIIYNLGVLSFSEKEYQFATLKVLGFKNKQIKNIFVKQNLWLAIFGIILGLPLGFLMTDYIFKSALGDNYDFTASISLKSYLLAAIGSFIVSFVVNKVLSKKVNKVDMVTSLKANE